MRYVLVILGLLATIGGLGLVKFSQISSLMAMGKQMEKAGPPPEAVGSAVAEMQTWEQALTAVGSVASVKGVALSNDAPGVVSRIHFESGTTVKKGQVLVELDTSVERAQLASARARRDLATLTEKRSRSLFDSKVIAQSQLDNDEANRKTAETDFNAIQAQIERKVVRAPFAGKLGMREINLGQYLNPGTPIAILEATGAVYVDFTLPQSLLPSLSVGMPVRLTIEGAKDILIDGAIAAVDPTVDNTTRSVKLRASVENQKEKLRPGMFVNVSVILPTKQSLVIVPATAVVHAPFGDSVFVIEDKKPGTPGADKTPDGRTIQIARQQFVRVGDARGDFMAVLEGIKAGQHVVSAGAFKLRNGSPITVDDRVKPTPQLNPHPENR